MVHGPLPACPAGEAVRRLTSDCGSVLDPCRLARQVKQFAGCVIAPELLHLPGKPAGVGVRRRRFLAAELLHLPDKPAGVRQNGCQYVNSICRKLASNGFTRSVKRRYRSWKPAPGIKVDTPAVTMTLLLSNGRYSKPVLRS